MLWWWKWRLASKNPETRIAAIEKIAGYGEDSAVDVLLPCLDDKKAAVRLAALEALHEFGREVPIKFIAALTEDRHTNIRIVVAKILGSRGGKAAVTGLLKLLSDHDGSVQKEAVKSLKQLQWKPRDETQWILWDAARGQLANAKNLGIDGLHLLFAGFNSTDSSMLSQARKAAFAIRIDCGKERFIERWKKDAAHVCDGFVGLTAQLLSEKREDLEAAAAEAESLAQNGDDMGLRALAFAVELRAEPDCKFYTPGGPSGNRLFVVIPGMSDGDSDGKRLVDKAWTKSMLNDTKDTQASIANVLVRNPAGFLTLRDKVQSQATPNDFLGFMLLTFHVSVHGSLIRYRRAHG